MSRVALCLIVKDSDDEAAHLKNCLKSLAPHVDGIFINLNRRKGVKPSAEMRKLLRKTKAEVIETEWTGNFVAARTANFAQVPADYDWILWADTDDTIENPKKIREVAAIMPTEVDGVYIKYDYAHDEYGNVTVAHWVARLVRNNGSFGWKSSFSDADVTVHETLNERRKVGKAMNDEFWVVHHADEARAEASLERNITLLEGMYKASGDNPDPRILFYLATHYIDANRLLDAKLLFEQYLTMSGWAEERSQAWVYLGMIYDAYEDLTKARGCYIRALAENPNDPNPYVELGELDSKDGLWQKAIYWLEMATGKELDPTSAVYRPMDSTYRAYKLLSQAYVNVGAQGHQKAREWLTKAQKLRPFDPELLDAQKLLDELTEIRDLTKATSQLLTKLKADDELARVPSFLASLPSVLQDNPLVASARNHYQKPVTWPAKSIAIVCGTSALGHWGPWSLQTGVGGSEEAVIQLSQQLTALGWQVTVYATPGPKAGTIDDVHWKHYWEFNGKDEFDVLISWRDPSFFDKAYKARASYLWLHDVIDDEELTEARLNNLTGVIFVGQYHRDIFPVVPDNKAIVSGNGIDPEQFSRLDGLFERDPHRCIYMSAHERGLELLYRIWPDVRKAVPDATLDVYYGWGSYDEINRNNPERLAWKAYMLQQEAQLADLGVTNHGKVGHADIAEATQQAGVWAYPSPFPEVYCITAVKAQAGGAWPVTSDYAALKENVHFGYRQPMREIDKQSRAGWWTEKELGTYRDALIQTLQKPIENKQRKQMMAWARENKSWAQTAKQWDGVFRAN